MHRLFQRLPRFVLAALLRIAAFASHAQTVINTPTRITADDFTLDGQAIVVRGTTLAIEGTHRFASLTLTEGAVLTHSTNPPVAPHLIIAGDFVLSADSTVDLRGRGAPRGQGAGTAAPASCCSAGGSHGGAGGWSESGRFGRTHGSFTEPFALGSGGALSTGHGDAGAGGGALRLEIAGTASLEGTLNADGTAGGFRAGGGAGGSLWIQAETVSGRGTLSARGGAGGERSGGGGGGRVALHAGADLFTGSVAACGGAAGDQGTSGGAGTVYRRESRNALGTLILDNCGVPGGATDIDSLTVMAAHLVVRGAARLTHRAGEAPARLQILGDVQVDPDGEISVSGRGDGPSSGPGSTPPLNCCTSGGSHGGTGGVGRDGARGGLTFGSVFDPVTAGSGGGQTTGYGNGGHGGGALQLEVQGTLRNLGRITSEGAPGGTRAGGGAGGSLWIIAPRLEGTGTYSVAGGDAGDEAGGGGGGRLAVFYDSDDFRGQMLTHGGTGTQYGGAGTLYRRQRGTAKGVVILDNAGRTNGVTEVDQDFLLNADLVIRGQAALGTRYSPQPSTLRILGTVTVETNGTITASGRGHARDTGPGRGTQANCCTAGASHAGSGGRGRDGASTGSNYGDPTEPVSPGSGAGSTSGYGRGGDGGGALRLLVSDSLRIDGRIEARGGRGGNRAGGGSGGSLWISAPIVLGSGVISVAGGDAEPEAGGGGGGRIAIHVAHLGFTGDFETSGGLGGHHGGGGTTYLKVDGLARGQLIIDNRGRTQGFTEVDSRFTFAEDLVLRHGAILAPRKPGTPWDLHFPGNVHIEPGAALSATGRGHDGGDGEGAPPSVFSYGAGGSHGGRGGHTDRSFAPTTHGSLTEPTTPGSGGANASTSGSGGRGGGAVRLRVDGELRIDGSLETDGAAGEDFTGGGSGGSLWVTATRLTGAGRISASGGSAFRTTTGGGGGGGRIALYFDTWDESLRDQLSAGGGDGMQQGGGGTIYLKPAGQQRGEFVVDRSPLDKDTAPTEFSGLLRLPGSLRIRSGAIVSHPPGRPFHLGVEGDLVLSGGAEIDLDGLGSPPGTGPSGATNNAGAGHGGPGGNARSGLRGGLSYGLATQPVDLGSGGGNRAGGGAARLSVAGTLRLDGIVSANATASTSGGGASGGSLSIEAAALTGDGFLLADGGDAGSTATSGGGAGGRIAVRHHGAPFPTNRFSARGGAGWQAGADGSVQVVHHATSEPPAIELAEASPSLTEVSLTFNQLLHPDAASDTQRFRLSDGTRILDAELLTDLRTVRLRTEPLGDALPVMVIVDGVTNAAGIAVRAPLSSPAFTPRATQRGLVRQDLFRGIPGSRLAELLADPRWPDAPDATRAIPRLTALRDDLDGDQLGARLNGFIIPEHSGWHRFFMTADDNAAFYLSEDHSPSRLRLVASEPGRGFPGEWTTSTRAEVIASRGQPPANQSPRLWLEAGRHYWFEARLKEGTGTEHLSVTWQAPGEPEPAPNEGSRLTGHRLAFPPMPGGPRLLSPPKGGTFALGDQVTLTVTATGTPPLAYQWFHEGLAVAGATSDTLQVRLLAPSDFGAYSVRVADASGSVDSPLAWLQRDLPGEPVFAQPPLDTEASLGQPLVLAATVDGEAPIAYQWRLNGQEIPGADAALLYRPAVSVADAGAYTLVVSNRLGVRESDPARVRLNLPVLPFADLFALRTTVTTTNGLGIGVSTNATREPAAGEPRHAGRKGGGSLWLTWRAPAPGVARFSTQGSDFDTLLAVYQGTQLAGLREIASDDDSGGLLTSLVQFNVEAGVDYHVALDGYAGASGTLVLAWELTPDAPPLPVITQHPEFVLAAIGGTVTFTAQAQPANLRVQWLFQGRDLPGQNSATLRLSPVAPSHVGAYAARFISPAGAVLETRPAFLEVVERPESGGLLSADKLEDLFPEDVETIVPSPAATFRSVLIPRPAAPAPIAIGLPGSQWTDTTASTRGDEDPPVCRTVVSASRWFRFRFNVPGAGATTVRLTTDGTEIASMVAVFTNRHALRLLSCDVASPPGKPSAQVQFPALRGVDYLVLVDTPGGRRGPLKLNWSGDEEVPAIVRLQDDHLYIELRVAPADYFWQTGTPGGVWLTLWRTNVTDGVFRFLDPQPAHDASRFFRLQPATAP